MGPPALRDTGLPQQVEIFRLVRERLGTTPPVLDAEDVLRDPRGSLVRLCAAFGVEFSERMLTWPAGPRETDGVWGKYWYDAVERSTGFEPFQPRSHSVPKELEALLAECLPSYEELSQYRLVPA